MTKHERFGEFKTYVKALAKKCRDLTFQGEYQIDFQWHDEQADGTNNRHTVYAEVIFDSVYLQTLIHVFPPMFDAWMEGDYGCVGQMILHEFCHGFIEPIKRLFWWNTRKCEEPTVNDTVERQTQRIAYTVFALMPKGWYLPKNLAEAVTHEGNKRRGR